MKRRLKLIAAIAAVAALMASCEKADAPKNAVAQKTVEQTAEKLSNLKRVKVTDNLSEKLLEASSEDILEIFGPEIKSVKPTFLIGGKWEKKQREYGLHLWFDVEKYDNIVESKAMENLRKVKGILEIENVAEGKLCSVEMSDPMYNVQWHYYNTGAHGFVPGIDIKLQEEWDIYGHFGNESVVVAVVDGGVDINHQDLAGNIWVNEAEMYGEPGVDDDGNGYVDDIHGYNFVNDNGGVFGTDHGTHVAGTIAAVNDNGIGVCGVAGGRWPQKGVRIMSCQTFDNTGKGTIYAQRIFQYAAENGASICQNSWGSDQPTSGSQKLAIDYFTDNAGCDPDGNQIGPMKGGLVIFSAGNDSEEHGYPGDYESCVAVAAISPMGLASYYTNYGDWVDVCAPGGDASYNNYSSVYSTIPGNLYGSMQGTSMACPHVSGLAALILSERGRKGYTSEDLRKDLMGSCDPSIYDYQVGSMQGKLGKGMINAVYAFAQFSTIAPDKIDELEVEVQSNSFKINFEEPYDRDDVHPFKYKVYLDRKVYTFNLDEEIKIENLEFNKEYSLAVAAVDFAGNEAEKSTVRKVTTGINNPPVIECSEKTLPVDILQGHTKVMNITVSDPDNHSIDVSWTIEEKGVSVTKMDESTYRLTISGKNSTVGKHRATFKATDSYGKESPEFVVEYNILQNHAPEYIKTISDICLNSKGGTVSIPANEYFRDIDGEDLNYLINSDSQKIATAMYSNGNIVVKGSSYGTATLTVTVTDGMDKQASGSFKVLVRDGSRAIDIYPNPVTTVLNIRTGEKTNADIDIFSASGRKVFGASSAAVEPFKPVSVDMTDMAAGEYTVMFKSNGKEEKYYIVKL